MLIVRATAWALAVGAVLGLASAAAFAATPGNSWSMDLSGGVVRDVDDTEPMTFTGSGILPVTGSVGGAVQFTRAPSLGVAANSRYDNPGSQNFAMGIVFTSQPIPSSGSYSGNLIQKGLFGDPGQVKMQLVAPSSGTVNCRIKGTAGARIITSTVNVDDGGWHRAVCWRSGAAVGVTVDGVVTSQLWNPGSIANTKDLTIGNKTAKAGSSDQHFGRTDFATWVVDPDARSLVEQQVLASG